MSIRKGSKYYRIKKGNILILGNKTLFGHYRFTYETELVIARAKKEAFTLPSLITLISLDKMIIDLKVNNLWDRLDAFFQFGYNNASLSNFSRIDIRYPFNPLATITGGVTYNTQGWIGNGTNGFITINLNPTVGSHNYSANLAAIAEVEYVTGNTSTTFSQGNLVGNTTTLTPSNASQRVNNGIGATYDLSGIGFKYIGRLTTTTGLAVNKSVSGSLSFVGSTGSLTNGLFYLLRNQTTGFSTRGLSNAIILSSFTLSETQTYRTIINNHLSRVGLTQVA